MKLDLVVSRNQVRQSEELFSKAFHASPAAISITTLAEGRYLDVNESLSRILGYPREEIVGRTVDELGLWVNLAERARALDELRAGQSVRGMETQLRMKSGVIRDASVSIELITLNNEPCALTITEDVTERKHAFQLLEQRIAERTRELSALLQVSHKLTSTLELEPLLNLILDQLKTMVDYTGAAIMVPQGDELAFLEYRGPMARDEVMQLHLPIHQVTGYEEVMFRREPVIVADIWGAGEQAQYFQRAGDLVRTTFGYAHSWLGVPLVIKDRLIGILRLDHRDPNHFTVQHAQLALAIANQAAVAIENARLYEHAQALAVLEERQRLARELHDSVSQALYGIELGTQTAHELLDSGATSDELKSALSEPLDYILDLADAGLAEMRALIFDLRPESLEHEGLVAGLIKQATSLRVRHHIQIETNFCAEPEVSLSVKETLYRIAQEAMHNIVKHARANQAALLLECDSDRIILEIRDHGVGFDANAIYHGHLGLQSMRERAMRLNGRLEIESHEGQGTRVRVEIPACS
jgi:PAS domain S-box-containing protein